MFDGSNVTPVSIGDAVVRTHAIGGGRVLRRPGLDTSVAPGGTAHARICRGFADPGITTAVSAPRPRPLCGRGIPSVRTPHWAPSTLRGVPVAPAFELSWSEPGQHGGLRFAHPLDLSAAGSVDVRTIVDTVPGQVRLRVRLHDAVGHSRWLRPIGGTPLPALPDGGWSLAKRWAQNVRIPTAGISRIDLAAVTRVDVQGVSDDGRIWILDVAAVPTTVAPVPVRRLATLDLHDVSVSEGDGSRPGVLQVPYTIEGQLTAPARVALSAFDAMSSRWQPPVFADIAPGTTAGTIPLPYSPDELDDPRVQLSELTVYPVRGVMTRDATATARILDDDPSPRVRVTRVEPRIDEGSSARWRVTLAAPVNFAVDVSAEVVRGAGRGPRAQVGDVGRKFRVDHIDTSVPAETPLHSVDLFLGETVMPGRTTVTVSIPLRRDHRVDGGESITVRLRIHGIRFAPVLRTIAIDDD
jgi:hypothetical protein